MRTVPTWRTYLTETAFAAILEGDEETLQKIKSALEDPTWGIWFGRKTCLPATPLTPTLGETPDQALQTLLQKIPKQTPRSLEHFDHQEEIPNGQEIDSDFFQSDQPTAFGHHQGPVPAPYRARAIRTHHSPSE